MKKFTLLKNAVLLTVALFAGTVTAQTVIFQEDFTRFAKGEPNASADGANIATSLDDYTTVPGWTGENVYQAGGTAKMGTSSKLGFITTPAVDLSDATATYTLQFKACAWAHNNEATDLLVYVDDNLAYTATGMNKTDYTFTSYTTVISGTASSKIRFEGMQAARGRFFLDDVVIIKGSGGVLPPVVSIPATVSFPTLEPGQSTVENISLSASNLTESLTVEVTGTGFTLTSPATVSKEAAEAGATITVSFAPTAAGNYNGTLTVSGGGLTESKVSTLTAKSLALVGDGTKTNPFTVADVIALENTNKGPHWVKGYIVGAIVFNKPSEFAPPFSTATALYIGDDVSERDTTLLMPVQLPSGDVRAALNLMDNPDNVGKELTIYGNLEAYFSMPGLRSPTEYELGGGGNSVFTPEAENVIFVEGDQLRIKAAQTGLVEVYNVLGQQIIVQQVNQGFNTLSGIPGGQIYIVKFDGKTKKVFLR